MNVSEAIRLRRSVRNFIDKPVETDKIIMCLEAARLAPSACNSQPWNFIVVNDRQLKDKLCDAAFKGIHAFNSFCKTAPVIVVVITEKSKFIARIGEWLRGTKYCLIDIGIACEHFVLQAEELNLGTCWIGWFDEGAVKSTLGIPRRKKIDVLIALGYYDRDKLGSEHGRDTIEEIVSFNSYKPWSSEIE